MRYLVVLAAIASVLSGCGKDPAEQARQDAQMKEIRMQRMAREFVAPTLKDPRSAEFRNQKEFCGEVNSKNSFGAYTGFQRFIAGGKDMVILERESGMAAGEFQKLWSEFCSG